MNSEKDLTLPGLVHDLNNVFQALVDAADLLSSDPRWSHVSAAILRHVERGYHIAASLAAGSGASASVEHIVANAVSFVQDSMLAAKGPRLNFTCQADPDLALQRAWAWERVFINLFLNSARAMKSGGTIHVRAGWRK